MKIKRPFAIFVDPCDNPSGLWTVSIVGYEMDYCTQGYGPVDAVTMAADVLNIMTDPWDTFCEMWGWLAHDRMME